MTDPTDLAALLARGAERAAAYQAALCDTVTALQNHHAECWDHNAYPGCEAEDAFRQVDALASLADPVLVSRAEVVAVMASVIADVGIFVERSRRLKALGWDPQTYQEMIDAEERLARVRRALDGIAADAAD